ncbi:hypothetical protein [Deinococcus hohokamensis]|uniref:DUF11 domain-containing protein n=1 Tax=Deinococcus hohokamensis TaxID=309883 RepID=A0ABV9I6Q1_9DEIO
MKRILPTLLALLAAPAALAEGSISLAPNGVSGSRSFLETGSSGATSAGLARKTMLYVYADAGERILLGSSALGLGSAAIKVTAPNNTTVSCAAPGTAKVGVISTRAQEVNGPNAGTVTNGYVPCVYPATGSVTTSGIYKVEFLSPATGATDPPRNDANVNWTAQTASNTWVAAWDITVVDASNARKPGRAYAKYFALNVGAYTETATAVVSANISTFALTKDGYTYKTIMDFDPYRYVFFANNVGNLKADGTPLYKSGLSTTIGSNQHLATAADTETKVTHKIFLSSPDPLMPATASAPDGTEWLYRPTPDLPPQPTDLGFTGSEGTPGQAGSLGGTFTFTNPGSHAYPYRIVLPFSKNGVNTDRILVGTAQSGVVTKVTWDGKDGNGNAVAASNVAYAAEMYLASGEIHFPVIDAENFTDLTIERLTRASSVNSTLVYWDNAGVIGSTPQVAGQTQVGPTPATALFGVDSAGSNTMKYSGHWGNDLIVDTWAYYPSDPAKFLSGVAVREADVQISKAFVSGGAKGYDAVFTLVVKNLSTTVTARNVNITDPLAAGFTAMTWSCPSGCTTDDANNTGTPVTGGTGKVDTYATLAPQATVTITVRATISPSTTSTSLTNTAAATRGADSTDPTTSNNTSSANVTLKAPTSGMKVTKTVQNLTRNGSAPGAANSAARGDLLEYVISFQNTGDRTINSGVLKDTLSAYLTPAATATLTCPTGAPKTVNITSNTVSVDVTAQCGVILSGQQGSLTLRATVK